MELIYEERTLAGGLAGFFIYCDLGVLNVKVFDTFPGLEGCMAASDIVVLEDESPEEEDRREGGVMDKEEDARDGELGEEDAVREREEEERGIVDVEEEFGGYDAMAISDDIASIGSSSGLSLPPFAFRNLTCS
jgi:hypothetical protein